MGLLDGKFSLPGVGGAFSKLTSSVASSVSFAVSSATAKVSEAVDKTIGSFGGAGGFKKLGANTPSFEEMKSAALKSGQEIVVGGVKMTKAQIEEELASVNGQISALTAKAAAGVVTVTTDHLVTLSEGTLIVQFDVLPEIVEAHTAQYEAVAPAQFPGAFQKYKGTDSTQWTLNVTLISRTPSEANDNYVRLNTLRGWKQPFFGQTTGNRFPKQLGAPPPVLQLKGLRNLIGPVPVVITSLNWNWPKDVDYLPTTTAGEDGNLIPFPAVMAIAIQMIESYSTSQFNKFDLRAFRAGRMSEAFNGEIFSIESRGDEGE